MREGSDSALAAIVHRHGPTVWQAVPRDADPLDATTVAFAALLRARSDDAAEHLDGWLRTRVANAGTSPETHDTSPDADELDALWARLRARWPNGRRRMLPSHALAWIATLVVTVAVSAAVPWLALGTFAEEPSIPELRSFPVDAAPEPEEEPAEVEEPVEETPLPTYEFPVPPEDLEPPDEPATESGDETSESTGDAEDGSADTPEDGDETNDPESGGDGATDPASGGDGSTDAPESTGGS